MKHFENSDISNWSVRRVLRRQWRKGLMLFFVLLSPIVAAAVFWGNTFRSDARIFVRLGRESVAMDPTVSSSRAITVNDTREIEINSVLEIFQSRDLAELVVDKLGVETILSGQLPSDATPTKPSALSNLISQIRRYKDGREVSLKERAITALLRELKVWSPKKTTVIGIEYECKSPEVAQMVVREVIDGFKSEHARVHQTKGSFEFLQQQSQLLKDKVLEAQSAIRDAKNEIGLVSIEGQKQLLQDELAVLETALINANSELAGSRARLLSLEQSSAVLPERQLTEGVTVANDATSRMREVLYEVQLLEREMAAKYAEGHPVLKRISEQVQQAQAIYEAQADVREQKTTDMNPARQQLQVSVLSEHANYESLKARVASLTEQRRFVDARLQSLNADEFRLAELQQTADQAVANFRNSSERMEQARLDQQLERDRISNLNIIQPASFIEKPASPNRVLLLALGFVCASCGGVGVMLLSEFFATRTVVQKQSVDISMPRPQKASRAPAPVWHEQTPQHSSPSNYS